MTTPIGSSSNFILNIVELQNTITSAGGTTPFSQLATTVAQLQEMVIYEEKRIATNTISAYNTTPIQVTDSMNFAAGTSLTLNGGTVSTATATGGGAGAGPVSTVGYYTSFTNYYSTSGVAADLAIAFQVEGAGAGAVSTPMTFTAGGETTIAGGLRVTGAGTPAFGRYLTCMDALGTAEWQDPGSVSDVRWKEDVRPFEDHWRVLGGIQGVRFRWGGVGAAAGRTGSDVGVIAQDVLSVLPEAVIEGVDGLPHRVSYEKLVPVLVEAVKELGARVAALEARGP